MTHRGDYADAEFETMALDPKSIGPKIYRNFSFFDSLVLGSEYGNILYRDSVGVICPYSLLKINTLSS